MCLQEIRANGDRVLTGSNFFHCYKVDQHIVTGDRGTKTKMNCVRWWYICLYSPVFLPIL